VLQVVSSANARRAAIALAADPLELSAADRALLLQDALPPDHHVLADYGQ